MPTHKNPELSADYTRRAQEFDTQADDDHDRMDELDDDDNTSYRDYLRRRRDFCRYLADNARESAEYFGE